MRITHPKQLDALPGNSLIRMGDRPPECSSGSFRWGRFGGLPRKISTLTDRTYLLEAIARTPEDLERLLPGAVICRTEGDQDVHFYLKPLFPPGEFWRGPFGAAVDSIRLAAFGAWEILHPGYVIGNEGEIVEMEIQNED